MLNFPYKDCILKGAQSKDEDKSDEIFFNEILGSDEIDVLFKPKALQNFELISPSLAEGDKGGGLKSTKNNSAKFANAESTHPLAPSAREGEYLAILSAREGEQDSYINLKSAILNKPNLLIKGNNLLALHSLKKRKDIYGQVKLIYIDPPYNTGNDSFNYNDKFNHSAWLCFMKNRLEIAKEFLRDDGVIFVQCDDNEQAYLKVLMDEIFGRENFVGCITWHRKRGKDNSAKFLSRVSEYILVFARQISHLTFSRTNLDDSTLEQYTNPDNDPRGNYRKLALWRRRGQGGSKEYSYTTKEGIILESRAWLCSENTMQELDNENKLVVIGNNLYRKLFLSEHEGSIPETIWVNLSNTANAKDEIKALFLENKKLKTDEESNLFSTPKPEALLKRIIEISTQENDLVMDFFAGSGTTLAVAHKMKRRFVGIEQMDYIESITKERLIKVINGEQGGVSKAVNFVGGGEFVYVELMPLNAIYKARITQSQNDSELARIYKDLEQKAFIDYRVDIKALLKDKDFESLDLESKKQILCEILDSNMDYVPYGDMEDSSYGVDREIIELNKAFYGDL